MKSAETCSCPLCNKLHTKLYHHIVVLDKYIHSNLVYYKHNGNDEPYEIGYSFLERWLTKHKCFKLQKKVVSLICNVKRKSSCREFFRTFNILPVPRVYIMETVYCIKVNNKGIKQNLSIRDYETRHRSDFQTQFCRTGILKECH